MTNWHGYFAIEDVNLVDAQQQELWQVLKTIGTDNEGPSPQFRNHWRFSLNRKKVIFEALFDRNQLTINQFKGWLGSIFSVDPATIDNVNSQKTFSTLPTPIITFGREGTNIIRFAAFGGLEATWPQSRREVLAYLAMNPSEWEEEIV